MAAHKRKIYLEIVMLKIKYLLSFVLITAVAALASAQSLPEGKWQLVAYNFTGEVDHPIPGLKITLNIHPDGKLGGGSGCNAYGGEYTVEDGKLKISHIISTMMACQEPSPEFEGHFYNVLNSATEFEVKKGELTLTDKATHHFMRFVEVKPAKTDK